MQGLLEMIYFEKSGTDETIFFVLLIDDSDAGIY